MTLQNQRLLQGELGLQVGGAGYDFEGKWKDKGLFAYHTGKYAGCAYFGTGGTADEELQQKGSKDKYRLWKSMTPTCQTLYVKSGARLRLLLLSYYLYSPDDN